MAEHLLCMATDKWVQLQYNLLSGHRFVNLYWFVVRRIF